METGSFTFDCDVPRIRVSDEQIVEGLRRFGALQGNRPYGRAEFDAWKERCFGAATAARRFGSWRAALKKAGIEGGRPGTYRPEELIERLEAVWRKLGRPPGVRTLFRLKGGAPEPYERVWGSLENACRRLAEFHRGSITREELLRGGAPPPARRQGRVAPGLRWAVLRRDGFRCVACGMSAGAERLHVDHIIPASKGGGDQPDNLRTLCRTCNLGRGNRD